MEMVARFLASPRAAEIAAADEVHRELEFLLAWPPDDKAPVVAAKQHSPLSSGIHRLSVSRCGRPVAAGGLQDQSRDGRHAGGGRCAVRNADACVRAGGGADPEMPAGRIGALFSSAGAGTPFRWDADARRRVVELVDAAPAPTLPCRAGTCDVPMLAKRVCRFTMHGACSIPEEQRRFAVEVVRRLREAGFEAYWAGGCVRDQLLGRTPKDYDVATNAVPDQVRRLFGRRRTLAIGAAFGVIAVIGPKAAGMVEVTTFRRDAPYSDGRHPDSVTFSSAEEDASRRDFTINGLFYDPIEQRVIDFVGGQTDLAAKRLRAIGHARERFAEDKLRMLRAVRFAATFDFTLDDEVRAAIAEMAAEIHVVSPERIAMEMRRMLADPSRAAGVRLMLETGWPQEVLPEIVPHDDAQQRRLDETLAMLARLGRGLRLSTGPGGACCIRLSMRRGPTAVCRRWRLSNKETERVGWLVENHAALADAQSMRMVELQPLLVAEGIDDLLALTEAESPAGAEAAAYCRRLLAQPREHARSAAAADRRRPAGPRHSLRAAVQDAVAAGPRRPVGRRDSHQGRGAGDGGEVESGEWRAGRDCESGDGEAMFANDRH